MQLVMSTTATAENIIQRLGPECDNDTRLSYLSPRAQSPPEERPVLLLAAWCESTGGEEAQRRSWSGGWRHMGGQLCPPVSAVLQDERSYACSLWRRHHLQKTPCANRTFKKCIIKNVQRKEAAEWTKGRNLLLLFSTVNAQWKSGKNF